MSASERIREAAALKGMTLKEFSEAAGFSYRTVQNYVGEERGVGSDFLAALSSKMGISATWVLTGLGAPMLKDKHPIDDTQNADFIPIPRYSIQAALGAGAAVPEVEAIQGWHPFRRDYLARRGLNPKRLSVIIGKGDSMTPDIHDGDPVLIDHADTTPRDGMIYAIRMGDDLSIKRVLRLPDGLQLISSNKVYPPITLTAAQMDGAAIIARVVASSHDW